MSIARGMLEFMADVQKLQVMRFGTPECVPLEDTSIKISPARKR
jgi:hypothetical protein